MLKHYAKHKKKPLAKWGISKGMVKSEIAKLKPESNKAYAAGCSSNESEKESKVAPANRTAWDQLVFSAPPNEVCTKFDA